MKIKKIIKKILMISIISLITNVSIIGIDRKGFNVQENILGKRIAKVPGIANIPEMDLNSELKRRIVGSAINGIENEGEEENITVLFTRMTLNDKFTQLKEFPCYRLIEQRGKSQERQVQNNDLQLVVKETKQRSSSAMKKQK